MQEPDSRELMQKTVVSIDGIIKADLSNKEADKTNDQITDFERVNLKEMIKELSARNVQDVYGLIGMADHEWGCIMLDVNKIMVTDMVEDAADDLYYHPDPTQYKNGAVAETTAHMTVLYGLLESGKTWREAVDYVLNNPTKWDVKTIEVDHVDTFDGDPDCYCVVAHIKVTDELLEGNTRVGFLPHISTFPTYKPHVTLAYVKKDEAIKNKWVAALDKELKGKTLNVTGINYGD